MDTLSLMALALSVPPVAEIPRPIACMIRGGENARFIILGDSLSNSISGTFWDNGADRTHFPLNTGIHNVWQPAHGWRGVNVSPADGAYKNWRGVACQGWGAQYGPRVNGSDYALGQTIDSVLEGDIRSTLFTDSNLHTSLASAAIGRGELRIRQIVYEGSYTTLQATRTGDTALSLTPTGSTWQTADYPAGAGFDPDSGPFVTTVTGPAIFGGTYFYDAASDGMSVVSIAQGGDNTLDHLRTASTFGTPGWYATRERGYHDPTAWLKALEAMDGTPIVVIALGTNIASPDNGGAGESSGGLTTQAYSDNVRAIMDRWRGIYDDPYFLLIAMYGFGASPNPFVESRAEWLWEIAQDDSARIGFVNLPAAMAPFDPAWYFSPTDYHLSSAGSVRIAEIIWDAAGATVCPADLTLDNCLNTNDFFLYLSWYAAADPRADLNGDESLSTDDFFLYLDWYTAGC